MNGDLENHSKDPVIPFDSMVDFHPVSAKDQSRLHQFGKEVRPGIFLGDALRVKAGKEICWSRTVSWKCRTREKSSKTRCKGSHAGTFWFFPVADGQLVRKR